MDFFKVKEGVWQSKAVCALRILKAEPRHPEYAEFYLDYADDVLEASDSKRFLEQLAEQLFVRQKGKF